VRPLLEAAGHLGDADVPAADRGALGEAVREGYLAGFRAVMAGSTVVCVAAALIALLGIPARVRPAQAAGAVRAA